MKVPTFSRYLRKDLMSKILLIFSKPQILFISPSLQFFSTNNCDEKQEFQLADVINCIQRLCMWRCGNRRANEWGTNDLPDLLRIVPCDKTFFEKLNYKLTPHPAMFTYTLLVAVGPFSILHTKPCLSSTINVKHLFIFQSCGGAFFFAYFLHLHLTEHTYWLALDVGCMCGQTMCVRSFGEVNPVSHFWNTCSHSQMAPSLVQVSSCSFLKYCKVDALRMSGLILLKYW